MGLDDDRLNDTPHVVSQLSPPRIRITEPSRGRAQDLATRKQQNRRRYSRTLSGHRHSWREPSPDLFTVDESEEEDVPALRRAKTRKPKDGAERRKILPDMVEHAVEQDLQPAGVGCRDQAVEVGVVAEVAVHDLDRAPAVQAEVEGLVDGGHAAARDLRTHAVAPLEDASRHRVGTSLHDGSSGRARSCRPRAQEGRL